MRQNMLNIEMEFKSGILWVRLSGKLYENTVNTFNEEVNMRPILMYYI